MALEASQRTDETSGLRHMIRRIEMGLPSAEDPNQSVVVGEEDGVDSEAIADQIEASESGPGTVPNESCPEGDHEDLDEAEDVAAPNPERDNSTSPAPPENPDNSPAPPENPDNSPAPPENPDNSPVLEEEPESEPPQSSSGGGGLLEHKVSTILILMPKAICNKPLSAAFLHFSIQ